MHSTPLGRLHAEHTVVNAFGDRYVHALCPSSPAARAYAAGLVTDVAQRGVTRIDLEAFGGYGYAHGAHHDKPRTDLSVAAEALLSLCFCRSCAAAFDGVGIDVDLLRRETIAAIDAEIEAPTAGKASLDALAALPGGIQAVEVRARATLDLVAAVREKVGADVELYAIGTAAPLGLGDPMAAGDHRLREHVDGVIVPLYGLDPDGVAAEIDAVRSVTGLPITAGLRFVAPDGGPGRLEQSMRAAGDVGVTTFRHYHFGLATSAELQELGRAVGSS